MSRRAEVRFVLEDEDGNEVEHKLPAKYEVCHRCQGEGTHVNPNVDGHGITAEEWERDWDDESREAYFEGRYDVPCEECDGDRVVAVVDEEHLTDAQKVTFAEWQEHQEQVARWDYEDRMTRRGESGGYDG